MDSLSLSADLKAIAEHVNVSTGHTIMLAALKIEESDFLIRRLQSQIAKDAEVKKEFIQSAGYADNIPFDVVLNDLLQKSRGSARPKEWLCTKDVAEHFGISRKTVSQWVKKGVLPEPEKMQGRNPRWKKIELDALYHRRDKV